MGVCEDIANTERNETAKQGQDAIMSTNCEKKVKVNIILPNSNALPSEIIDMVAAQSKAVF